MVPVLSPSAPQPCASRREFVEAVLAELGARQIRYAVLHSWQQLPDHLPSDLDIAVARADAWRIPGVLAAIERRGFRPVQYLNYAVEAHYFVFAWTEGTAVATAAVDFITEHREGNLVLTSGDELVEGRRQFRGFWIPSAAAQLRYLLSKKVLKRSLPARQSRQLAALAEELGPEETERVCDRLFGRRWGRRAAEATRDEKLGDLLAPLRMRMWLRAFLSGPWTLLRYPLTELPRVMRRFFEPTGLTIAVLGPDGAGKTTLIENLGVQLDGAFRLRHLFHWRPGLLARGRFKPESRPHSRAVYGRARSIAHMAVHFADYVLGFPLRIRPLLVRSGLVLFDRYFDDVLADPARYRSSAPAGLAKMVAALTPRPDLMFVLDAPARALAARKRETTEGAIALSAERYRRLAERPSARLLDATRPPDELALEAAHSTIDLLHARMVRRHGGWLREPNEEATREVSSFLDGQFAVLPGGRNPRWLVQIISARREPLAVWAPYARKGHLLKTSLEASLRLGVAPTLAISGDGRLTRFVQDVLGIDDPRFTVSLGAPGRFRKATVQIDDAGGARGFLKIPLTDDASQRIENEAGILRRLASVPALRPFLPEVLYAGCFDGRLVLLERAVGGKPGEARLSTDHQNFLDELARHNTRPLDARWLIDGIGASWEETAWLVEGEDRKAVDQVLRHLDRESGTLSLDCGLIHGDFAPWNTRRSAGALRVLDWEAASENRPHQWDAFHFRTQTKALLGRDCGGEMPGSQCSWLLYLIWSAARLLSERGDSERDLHYRLRVLREEARRTC